MASAARPRLTYANVVATLALFVALGGGAYASGLISGSKLKNRSVAGVKIKRNALTGSEINESRLGRVRRAAQADSATDSAKLGGSSPSTFERSTRIQFGTGDEDSATKDLLFAWPEMGLEIRTDGATTGSSRGQITLRNTTAQGFAYTFDGASGAYSVSAHSDSLVQSPVVGNDANLALIVTTELGPTTGGTDRTMFLRCIFNHFGGGDNHARCSGIRSRAN